MKVYISSTFRDLQDYREKAYRQLRRLRHEVVSMEDGVAAHQRPLRQCLADVEACDVYVGLFAWRYGVIPKEDNPQKVAITELEYRHGAIAPEAATAAPRWWRGAEGQSPGESPEPLEPGRCTAGALSRRLPPVSDFSRSASSRSGPRTPTYASSSRMIRRQRRA